MVDAILTGGRDNGAEDRAGRATTGPSARPTCGLAQDDEQVLMRALESAVRRSGGIWGTR